MSPPFQISLEAAQYLRERLEQERALDMETALVLTTRAEIRDKNGALLDEYSLLHYIVGYYTTGERPRDSFYDLFGHQVSIVNSVIDTLRGKLLQLSRAVVRFEGPERVRELLVATDDCHTKV